MTTSLTCACDRTLTRRLFSKGIECAGCGFDIEPRTIRFMCLNEECAFHVCNSCKDQAEAGTAKVSEAGMGSMEGDE
eukprot:9482003-Karenia_brevis.AAC.1